MRFAVALATTLLFAPAAYAQQPPAPPPPLVDWEKGQIKTTDLGNNTWMLEGQGGNITVAVGTDGIIMVDGRSRRFRLIMIKDLPRRSST